MVTSSRLAPTIEIVVQIDEPHTSEEMQRAEDIAFSFALLLSFLMVSAGLPRPWIDVELKMVHVGQLEMVAIDVRIP